MTRGTQAVLLTVTGAVLIRMAAGDAYLRYVNTWMRWPLIVCGVLLLVLSFTDVMTAPDDTPGEEEPDAPHVPRTAWLLFLPSLVIFLIAPPALGAHYAERAQTTAVPTEAVTDMNFAPLPVTDPAPLMLEELVIRAAYGEGATLQGRRLELTGFVSRDRSGKWYVTQFGINCCAADATVTRVIATGAEPPPNDQWVKVVGTYVKGTGAGGQTAPEVNVEDITLIAAPRNQYR